MFTLDSSPAPSAVSTSPSFLPLLPPLLLFSASFSLFVTASLIFYLTIPFTPPPPPAAAVFVPARVGAEVIILWGQEIVTCLDDS